MKWLSVKKYKLWSSGIHQVIVRVERHDKISSIKIRLASFSVCGEWVEYLNGTPLEEDGWKVTHFCIPDPIEIEEE